MGAAIKQGSNRRSALNEINVTPFVDVMLVLLIIFMVTAPMMQQGIDVDLPETASAGVETSEEPFTVVIKKDRTIQAGSNTIPMNQLQTKLRAIFETRKNKQLYLQADKQVDYGFVAEAMGEIRSAGISNIGLVTLPKSGK
ncbi:MAG: protein TolR [Bdellovibrionales bacterium]